MEAKQLLKVTFLGGLEDVGEKNMAVIEYGNDAIILDCGFNLGVDIPGVNYTINGTAYLRTIKHKIKAYVLTHGHLDHIGGLKHTVPQFPAPMYGSRYTLGVVAKTFEEIGDATFQPRYEIVDPDNHERIKIGAMTVEFIRVAHSIPDPTAICIETPGGRIIATGDFRLDPEPLDNLPTDTQRLRQLGNQGVLLLLSESSYANVAGRTPTEHTLQASFYQAISEAQSRVFVAVFSSNINRIQMIINAAVDSGRKVVFDGRSMLAYAEIAVRQGILKVPKGTIIAMRQANNVASNKVLILCTGGQGEPNAALQRMSQGEHKYITLKRGDTVLISSSPIPGNERSYEQIGNRLQSLGVRLYRHPTHQLDGCGPLHVSGHARRDELLEMIKLVRPKYLIPVHGGSLRRHYHAQLAIDGGFAPANIFEPQNGSSLTFKNHRYLATNQVAQQTIYIDDDGRQVRPQLHTKHPQRRTNNADQARFTVMRAKLLKPLPVA